MGLHNNTLITAVFDKRQDRSWWKDEEVLKRFCAEELLAGRLVLVLGAGVSMKFGLPGWDLLIKKAYRQKKVSMPRDRKSSLDRAEDLLTRVCKKNEIDFAETMRKALYEGFKLSRQALASKELLNAIGALMMPSVRGNVKEVITFNFDDLLETYLGYYGFVTQSVFRLPVWNTRADVRVYHPHGLLPVDVSKSVEEGILMARIQFDAQQPKLKAFYEKLRGVMQSSTCLFIGLSGDDDNLTRLLKETYESHCSRSYGGKACYWGIRFSDDKKDRNKNMWDQRGVYQQTLVDYDKLATWLFNVCQIASRQIK